MEGWNLKRGAIENYYLDDDQIWSLFNYVFSDSCHKRNTYKFGLIKALLDNIFGGIITERGIFYSYKDIYAKFAENYWNLIVKYDLRQMRKDGKSKYAKVETIFLDIVSKNPVLSCIEFSNIEDKTKNNIIKNVMRECKKNVIGALYENFDKSIYSFDLNEEGLYLNLNVYNFMLKYKVEIEKLNYYAWARFLEQINDDKALVRVIDKLELATPKRSDLSVYRDVLKKEFEENNCFYCGKKLVRNIHVDHVIPWSFVKSDKIWNFVLACADCNERKSNRVPERKYVFLLKDRNKYIGLSDNLIVQNDFRGYSDDILERMWIYAKMSGIKEYKNKKSGFE